MKNNIVPFIRPIDYMFCLESIKCWIRPLGNGENIVSFAWDDNKLICCILPDIWQDAGYIHSLEFYVESLIFSALKGKPLEIPEEFLDIEYTSDPIPGEFVNKKAETTQTVLGDKEYLLEYYRKRIVTRSGVTTNEVPNSESLRFVLNTLSVIYREWEEHNSINQIEKDAERLAREYPSMTREQWKAMLLKNLSEQ